MGLPHLKLAILQGPREGETLGFQPGKSVRIGRILRNNTFSIKDAGISSNHLSIEIESGRWVIRDLDSSNGTILNGSKIPPNTAFDLHHGDTIKIGEYTSIQVDLQAHEDSCLRRNPRRQATGKVNGGCREKLEEEEKDEKFEGEKLEAVVVKPLENKRKGRQRTGRVLKSEVREELSKVQLQSIDENVKVSNELTNVKVDQQAQEDSCLRRNPRRQATGKVNGGYRENLGEEDQKSEGEKLEAVVVEPLENKRRGRQRTGRVLRSEVREELSSVQLQSIDENVNAGNELTNVVPLQEKVEPSAKLRVTRSSKKKLQQQSMMGTSNSTLVNNSLDNSGLKWCIEEKVVEKKTRVGTRRNKLQEETSLCDQVAVSEDMVKENRESEADLNPGVKEGLDKDESRRNSVSVKETCSKREGEEPCSAQKKNLNENGDWPDLAKLTLGEWFDFLEVHFPKQIIDATEEIIDSMKEKAERVRDYMVKQKNDKVKLPMG